MDHAQQITQKWIDLCKYRRNMYWKMHYMFQRRSNYLAIPLIVIASFTGITSAAQIAVSSKTLAWMTAVTGSISAALAAFQKYYRYPERAEQCKGLAKSYGIIGTKLETKQALHTVAGMHYLELLQFAEEMRHGMEELMKDTDDAPIGFLTKEEMYINIQETLTQQDANVGLSCPIKIDPYQNVINYRVPHTSLLAYQLSSKAVSEIENNAI